MSDHVHEWAPDLESGDALYQCECGTRGRRDIRSGQIAVLKWQTKKPAITVAWYRRAYHRGHVADGMLGNGIGYED